ncbi:Uncharacterized protein Fot_50396 [Forsythia ovata]|uniref:Uncharacterized protein n=1 Tax=Forsythia ovata TaxID=205694 RepID=A0ABD1PY52_9LAMI
MKQEHNKYHKFRGRDVSLFQNHYPTLFKGISATGVNLRTPSTVSQAGANSLAPSQADDFQDADLDEHEGSDENSGPVDVPNCQTGMSQDEVGRAINNGKRKSSARLTRATKKKSGLEILSASINNLVSWGREVEDRRTSSSSDVPSIFECIRIVRNLPGIERGSQL